MKIGIITHYHNSINYGGVLQAYALCRYLNDHGHTACQIKYVPQNRKLRGTPPSITEVLHNANDRVMRRVFKKKNKRIRLQMQESFHEFRQSIPHTIREYKKETIGEAAGLFDAIIVGSDQVWNPNWFDTTFMLDFAGRTEKKIAYAASIGVETLDGKQCEAFQKYLRGFSAISTREHAAATALTPLVDIPVDVCVDPTLLLRVDEWDKLASKRIISGNYVFLYLLGSDKNTRKLAEKFARVNQKKLVMMSNLKGSYRPCDRRMKAEQLTNVTPQELLSRIKFADYILTDSFHACVFSLLYQKAFFAFERGGEIKMSSRIQELLEMFSCGNRFQTAENDTALSQMLAFGDIRPMGNTPAFEQARKNSIAFLDRNLNRCPLNNFVKK